MGCVCSTEQHHDSQDERRGGFVDFKDLLQDDDTIARDEGQDDGHKPGKPAFGKPKPQPVFRKLTEKAEWCFVSPKNMDEIYRKYENWEDIYIYIYHIDFQVNYVLNHIDHIDVYILEMSFMT